MSSFSIEVKAENGELHTFESQHKDALLLADTIQLNAHTWHCIVNNKSFTVEILETRPQEKYYKLKINGKKYEVNAKSDLDKLLQQLGMDKGAQQQVKELKAPMPGLILEVKVQEGAVVQKGDTLLILEAMKMENVIKAPADVTIKQIKVQKGENVEKNQLMMRFE